MSISYNGFDISDVNYNNGALSSVLYNGTEVWPNVELIDYVFPNATTKLTANGDYGIYAYVNAKNSESQDGWYTLDGSTETAWMLHSSIQDYGRMCIVFPFMVQLQSLKIINKSTLYAGTAATVNGLETGQIYVSPNVITGEMMGESIESMTGAMELYMEINRKQPTATASLKGYSTTHSNPDYANTWIRSVGIRGTTWGPGGTSSWKSIGEIELSFKADSSDLEKYGLA